MTNLAIAHLRVTFRLAEKGRRLSSLPVAEGLIERLAQLYGVGTAARTMRRVEHEAGAFRVSGYAALASVIEGSRSRQTLSVNGRWVRAEGLTTGIDETPTEGPCPREAPPTGGAARGGRRAPDGRQS